MPENPEEEKRFHGIAASPGVATGPAASFSQGEVEVPQYTIAPNLREEEISRFEQGLMETRKQISAIRAEVEEKVGEEEASIFDAHQLVLEDRALIEDTIQEVIETGFNVEHCFHEVASRYMEAFAQIDDEYIKERVSDIRDVSKRLICNLLGKDHGSARREGLGKHILISRDLSPSETALLEVRDVLAIVTEEGSRTSHSVIMARSLNIPCVVGLHGLLNEADFGNELLVDGFKGEVILNPSAETLERYGHLKSQHERFLETFNAERHLPGVTADGQEFKVLLNIEGVEDTELLANSGACGVGLFRTENLFLSASGFPDEAKQEAAYRSFVDAMAPHPVTIRTLDLGGDKNPHRSLTGYREANPFMGFRGIRFCLENTDVFKEQLRAILRASGHGKVRILYPMISSLEELQRANELLEEVKEELRGQGVLFDETIERGAMIEVPSAAVIVDLLSEHCDFFSIGTNDLMQYLLAVDRINDRISYLYDPNQPSFLRTLNFIFEQGKAHNKPVNVCGELAADPLYAPFLFGLGARELSVSLGSLARVKYLLRRVCMKEVRQLSLQLLRCRKTEDIRKAVEGYYCELVPEEVRTFDLL
ncbi:MAG: phosphoenolpyruvate--protein phosphotransferase [Verrucomicrobia bacterium]|jgi:phosphotransferase system enzyme I (PtsI)|nr:phosphoenolpyruvate--protein phosphotransferase [Verrucomicrobiota bacterium]